MFQITFDKGLVDACLRRVTEAERLARKPKTLEEAVAQYLERNWSLSLVDKNDWIVLAMQAIEAVKAGHREMAS